MDAATQERVRQFLSQTLAGSVVRGAAIAASTLDVALFFASGMPPFANALRVALGNGRRRRVLLERVAWSRDEHLDGDNSRALERELVGARFLGLDRPGEDRTLHARFDSEAGPRTLVIELFGGSGTWFLIDENDRILALARRVGGPRHMLAIGSRYEPAPPATTPTRPELDVDTPIREADLEELASHYGAIDRELLHAQLVREIEVTLQREQKGLEARRRGLTERRAAEERAPMLRREAELLLASPSIAKRGLDVVTVHDWYENGIERRLELDPKLTVRANAERRFDRARSLEEGRNHTDRELAALDDRERELDDYRSRLETQRQRATFESAIDELEGLRRSVRDIASPRQRSNKASKRTKPASKLPYREYRSLDGTPIRVGRGRAENDQLTLRHARGNDLWLHVGGGIPGSHVVIRLDRNKTASLETLLDAGTLALHYSKARGRPHAEVLYTPRKHVRKPKGFAPGLVEVLRSKTLHVRFEEERLARLHATGQKSDG
ncbi:MAG: DUF814 domain-containing protein [Planctomycetes bacterium]|nr:DUF814 domain-containing protein [Planctomycetota bacterium]